MWMSLLLRFFFTSAFFALFLLFYFIAFNRKCSTVTKKINPIYCFDVEATAICIRNQASNERKDKNKIQNNITLGFVVWNFCAAYFRQLRLIRWIWTFFLFLFSLIWFICISHHVRCVNIYDFCPFSIESNVLANNYFTRVRKITIDGNSIVCTYSFTKFDR